MAGQFETVIFLSQTQMLELQEALGQAGRPSSKAQAERAFLPDTSATAVFEPSEARVELVFMTL